MGTAGIIKWMLPHATARPEYHCTVFAFRETYILLADYVHSVTMRALLLLHCEIKSQTSICPRAISIHELYYAILGTADLQDTKSIPRV